MMVGIMMVVLIVGYHTAPHSGVGLLCVSVCGQFRHETYSVKRDGQVGVDIVADCC